MLQVEGVKNDGKERRSKKCDVESCQASASLSSVILASHLDTIHNTRKEKIIINEKWKAKCLRTPNWIGNET
jgi:hypothetical protein